MKEPKVHKSVMVEEAIESLHIKNQALYVDATLGTGGHTLEILKKGGKVLGIDMDPAMVSLAQKRVMSEFGPENYRFVTGNFNNLKNIVQENKWLPLSGVLIDLGVSNLHLKNEERGFSFENPDAPLDMRLNSDVQGVNGSDLLNLLREDQLVDLFMEVMDGGQSRWLARGVKEFRANKKIETVGDLLEISKGLKSTKTGLSQATLPFLALRIAVNSELDNLKSTLPIIYELLEEHGRLIVISFHSGEDKIVKEFAKSIGSEIGKDLTLPSMEEVYQNPRARSAKLRVIEKYAKN